MAEVLMVPKAKYIQHREADGELANEELAAHGPSSVALLLKLFANATDDGELALEVDGGSDNGVVYLVRDNGLLFMRSHNLDEPETAGSELFEILRFAQQALLKKMQEVSERLHNTKWLVGLEYLLWDAVVGVNNQYSQEDVADLLRLSRVTDGWYYYQVGVGATFVVISEWRQKYTHREEVRSS